MSERKTLQQKSDRLLDVAIDAASATPSTETRMLDEETERLIKRIASAHYAGARLAAWQALRSRISALIDEARKEGSIRPCAVCTSTTEYP